MSLIFGSCQRTRKRWLLLSGRKGGNVSGNSEIVLARAGLGQLNTTPSESVPAQTGELTPIDLLQVTPQLSKGSRRPFEQKATGAQGSVHDVQSWPLNEGQHSNPRGPHHRSS